MTKCKFFFFSLLVYVCMFFLYKKTSIYKQLKGTLFRIFQCLMRFNNEFWIRIWSCTYSFFFFLFFLNLVLQLIKTFYVNLVPLYGFNWLVTHINFVSSGQFKGIDMCLNFICVNLLTKTNYQHYQHLGTGLKKNIDHNQSDTAVNIMQIACLQNAYLTSIYTDQ